MITVPPSSADEVRQEHLLLRNTVTGSLQKRNMKNLSLSIESNEKALSDSMDADSSFPNQEGVPLRVLPVRTPSQQQPSRPQIVKRRSEASIYSCGTNGKSPSSGTHSPIHSTLGHKKGSLTLSRNYSLSLSVNTSNLKKHSRNRSQTISDIEITTPLAGSCPKPLGKGKLQHIFIPTPSKDSTPADTATTGKTYAAASTGGCKESVTVGYGSDSNPEDRAIYSKGAYPHGPLLVLNPNIYLYSEPKLTEILDFDLVINVAEEIPNLQVYIPDDFQQKIEYHHIEWSHLSKISEDLNRLTEIMHRATLQGKRILIHCQCGVSRSASLIVAYIMRYDNLSLNEAYGKLKSVAKDVSPNMGLIFQLMEWNDVLNKLDGNDSFSNSQSNNDNHQVSADSNMLTQNPVPLGISAELTPTTPSEFVAQNRMTTLK
ncbi:tyrosine/serine/threonine protein phosphatase MSG5 KNAG_0I01800 [Huiozyma naganishii CBS 8797]|uniref:protein-tyrosine-phosphatase n=1 Tax=Huiozyma naganishii (strain ATCC MYA-139 / BCRC 22969 / CBS 8797 / KCTC 17520 / NBRC 10181 / NCYC 3082 / Yp74L-3) TaxID=1071383 RepID=J7RAT0_HUIN7|nr:hypothetical protein KNAG_0I01800 [Kazachstania naganishii CBS 8797]CCK71965.1 hypothetical protein KNAG_0I01800 [Kazachstania naganishii CBS 8797]